MLKPPIARFPMDLINPSNWRTDCIYEALVKRPSTRQWTVYLFLIWCPKMCTDKISISYLLRWGGGRHFTSLEHLLMGLPNPCRLQINIYHCIFRNIELSRPLSRAPNLFFICMFEGGKYTFIHFGTHGRQQIGQNRKGRLATTKL